MTTPTPRADAIIAATKAIYKFTPEGLADFARQLERDLAAAQSEIAALREAIRSETALVHEARTDREMLRNALVKESEFRQETERQRAAAQEALEQERMKVSGCSTAALGYWKEGDSLFKDYECVAIHDVAKVYARMVAAEALAESYRKDAERYRWLRGNGAIISRAAGIPVHLAHFGIGLDAAIAGGEMTLQERLREVAVKQRLAIPTLEEAIRRAKRFADEAPHIAQLFPHDFDKAVMADALDAKDARIKELERIVYLFVEADDDRDAGSITDAEYKARIMDWTNRAREALK